MFMTEKVALVTGASRGIGKAIALKLGQEGYRVAIHYRSNKESAEALSREIKNSQIFCADLGIEEECISLAKSVKSEMGQIDVLVNNAGMSTDQVLTFAKPTDFSRLIDVNLKSVFNLSKACSRFMIRQKNGSIINITSVVGHTGNAGQSMYSATKGAITAFTKSISADLAPFGIRANCVAPGFIETDMTSALDEQVQSKILEKVPLKRLGQPEDVANAVEFLASDKSAYCTGSTLHVNGGMFTN